MSSAVYKVVDLLLVQEIVSLQLVEDKLRVCSIGVEDQTTLGESDPGIPR